LDSKIFDTKSLRREISQAVLKSAKVFKEATRRRMVESRPTGRVYPKRTGGRGFSRAHRASRRGQRPAVDTTTLINALNATRTGEFEALVDIANRTNPENGENARDYAERLQNNMGRPIMDKDDARIAEIELTHRINRIIK
jgi:hypothetical protein